jgi:hypothetical protein
MHSLTIERRAQVRGLTGLDETSARPALAWFGLSAGVAGRSGATLSPASARARSSR